MVRTPRFGYPTWRFLGPVYRKADHACRAQPFQSCPPPFVCTFLQVLALPGGRSVRATDTLGAPPRHFPNPL